MKLLIFLGTLLLSASHVLAEDYKYLECKGRIEYFELGSKQPTYVNTQRLLISLDEPNERISASTGEEASTEWRPVIIDKDKNQIITMTGDNGSEQLFIVDRANERYSFGGYFTSDSSQIITYNAEGKCESKQPAWF
tara:strand:- start:129 stop:539 length:411 start_codon:yes stop_codon:yes gene_type:complete